LLHKGVKKESLDGRKRENDLDESDDAGVAGG
jgi:hypothetical protein